MNDNPVLSVTNMSDMAAVLQGRCGQLIAGIQQGVHPTTIKEFIGSMYRVAEVMEEAWLKQQGEQEDTAEANGEDRAH